MKIKTVLFDLDGTLLPMDQDIFVKTYFGYLARRLAPLGYEADALVKAIWKGTGAMVQNDGSATNETVFWNCFAKIYGEDARLDHPHFEAFYREDFIKAKAACGFAPKAAEVIGKVKTRGLRLVLATNPIFPAIATDQRIEWAGLQKSDFSLVTTYENASFCKPNPAYYTAILETLGIEANECLMVGNDVTEDMVAETLGMKVFLLTDCLINKENKDISLYPHGDFDALLNYLDTLK